MIERDEDIEDYWAAELDDLIEYALDYPDLYNYPNEQLIGRKRIPYYVDRNNYLVLLQEDHPDTASPKEFLEEPKTEIEITVDIVYRREEAVYTKNTVKITDLTRTKIGSENHPVIERLTIFPNGRMVFQKGYQSEEKVNGENKLTTKYRNSPIDIQTIQKFVEILTETYSEKKPPSLNIREKDENPFSYKQYIHDDVYRSKN